MPSLTICCSACNSQRPEAQELPGNWQRLAGVRAGQELAGRERDRSARRPQRGGSGFWHGECVAENRYLGRAVGYLASAGWGYTIGSNIGLGYVRNAGGVGDDYLAAMKVLILPLEDCVAKINTSLPEDTPGEPPHAIWSGIIPFAITAGAP